MEWVFRISVFTLASGANLILSPPQGHHPLSASPNGIHDSSDHVSRSRLLGDKIGTLDRNAHTAAHIELKSTLLSDALCYKSRT